MFFIMEIIFHLEPKVALKPVINFDRSQNSFLCKMPSSAINLVIFETLSVKSIWKQDTRADMS